MSERLARPADAELETALAGLFGTAALRERRPLAYRSSYPLELLRVALPQGEREVVFKDLGRRDDADAAWEVKPRFVRDPDREIAVYRDVLAPLGLSAPAYLGSVVARDRHWLFLEHVTGEPLWQVGELDTWREAARWLAAMHVAFLGSPELPACLLRCDGDHYRRWLERARRFSDRAEVETLGPAFRRALDWLEGQPRTLLHGEFYPSNVLVARAGGQPSIRPLDWEMAGEGPGLLDLAALVSGWEATERRLIAEAYRRELPAACRPVAAEFRAALDHCRLLQAVQWLGWSPRWVPPPQHACDWLVTALEIGGPP